jgi:subfamily B ATP-binding cassette protein MsbA
MNSKSISGLPEQPTQPTADVLRRLWREWIVAHKAAIFIALLLMALVSASSAAYPALISYVFDALGAASSDLMWQIPPLIVAVATIKGLAMYFQVRQVTSLSLKVTTGIQKALTAHLINADLHLVMAAPAGEYVSRVMNDVLVVREAIIRLANNLVRDVLTVIIMVGMMVWFDWVLTLVVLGVYPLAMQPIVSIGKKQRKQSSDMQEQMADVTSLLSETLQSSRMTRAYTLEDHEIGRTGRAFDHLFNRILKLLLGRARIDPILEVLGGFAVAGVIAVAGWRVIGGQMEVGDVAGFITALLMLVQPVRGIGTLNAVVQESAAALNRIFALMDTERQITDPGTPKTLTAPKGEVAFEKVSFDYGGSPAVEDVSFTASPGQLVALVGPSGAGKTTIINLIPRLFDVTAGRVTLDGVDLRELGVENLRRQMALVSQDAILFNDTIANNIRLGRLEASEKDVTAAAKAAAAHDFITKQPQGYGTVVGEGGGRLSGGQRQRISIARAILRNAPVLLLDEATSALDSSSEKQIQKALDKLTAGRTTIVVAHRLSTVQNADMLIVMDQGRIVETGKHNQLVKKNGLYARLCALQLFSG